MYVNVNVTDTILLQCHHDRVMQSRAGTEWFRCMQVLSSYDDFCWNGYESENSDMDVGRTAFVSGVARIFGARNTKFPAASINPLL